MPGVGTIASVLASKTVGYEPEAFDLTNIRGTPNRYYVTLRAQGTHEVFEIDATQVDRAAKGYNCNAYDCSLK